VWEGRVSRSWISFTSCRTVSLFGPRTKKAHLTALSRGAFGVCFVTARRMPYVSAESQAWRLEGAVG
jgi:hypothetical protein